MKIAILTQPLRYNYGGILQNYALQKTLAGLGHEAETIYMQNDKTIAGRALYYAWAYVRTYVLGKGKPITPPKSRKRFFKETANLRRFIKEHIKTTEYIPNCKKLNRLDISGIDCFIVGSDQVWLKKFGTATFFGFLPPQCKARLYAYAASFGSDKWRFPEKLTSQASMLAKRFSAISVREKSGIGLCKNYLGVNATVVLDPTMLLVRANYDKLAESIPVENKKFIMTDILDRNEEKDRITAMASEKTGMEAVSYLTEGKDPVMPLEKWLSGFRDAEFVITDSFHGTVLSIIYNKPFITLMNRRRGADRFHSLLSMLSLEDRIADSSEKEKIAALLSAPVDYSKANAIIEQEKAKSMDFLRNIH